MARTAQLHVYYRVRPADAPAVIAAVRALHAEWRLALPTLRCALTRRAEAAELLTLMETYTLAEGELAAWQAEIERCAAARLGRWIVGARHVEVFVPCD